MINFKIKYQNNLIKHLKYLKNNMNIYKIYLNNKLKYI